MLNELIRHAPAKFHRIWLCELRLPNRPFTLVVVDRLRLAVGLEQESHFLGALDEASEELMLQSSATAESSTTLACLWSLAYTRPSVIEDHGRLVVGLAVHAEVISGTLNSR